VTGLKSGDDIVFVVRSANRGNTYIGGTLP
jgi:hypothetical protein